MRRKGFLRTSSRSVRASAVVLFASLLATGCLYGFRGGGGFPSDIRTLYIAPLENRTNQFEVDQELGRQLTEKLPRALGVRLAGQDVADAHVTARITGYTDMSQNYVPGRPGNVQVLQNQVQITISVQLVDVKRNEILWESQGLIGRGEYQPDSQSDQVARARAIESLIQQIIDGAQSQW
jgi:hypothetical protein